MRTAISNALVPKTEAGHDLAGLPERWPEEILYWVSAFMKMPTSDLFCAKALCFTNV